MTAVMEPRAAARQNAPGAPTASSIDHYEAALRHKRFAGRVTYTNDIRGLGSGPITAATVLAERRCDVIVLG
ncbi:MAG TPA: hypothetical protein VEA78_01355, partial [Acidimicrobiales bacterium]|nr:hypothetical protein [Acidimicrobiales bacterium]